MKKLLIIFVIILVIGGSYFGYKTFNSKKSASAIAEIKKGWYIEVKNETVKIRKEADRNSSILSEAKKGEVYKVDEMTGKNNHWYHIEYEKGKYGWIANPKNSNYLLDVNNPEDIASPTIKFDEKTYFVDSIDKINYDQITVTDDKPGVKVEHQVYHEVNNLDNKDQYWILYTATDAVGKKTTKLQKIEFNKKPAESEVLDFSKLNR